LRQLVFQQREIADQMHPALLEKRRHRLGAHELAAGRVDRAVTDSGVDSANRRLDEVAALIGLGDDTVGTVPAICLDGIVSLTGGEQERALRRMRDHAAATASRHWSAASARNIRSVDREVRWR